MKDSTNNKCDSCGKQHLKTHVHTIHEGHKDSKCEHCGKTFSGKQYLQKHIHTIHNNQCNDIFPSHLYFSWQNFFIPTSKLLLLFHCDVGLRSLVLKRIKEFYLHIPNTYNTMEKHRSNIEIQFPYF